MASKRVVVERSQNEDMKRCWANRRRTGEPTPGRGMKSILQFKVLELCSRCTWNTCSNEVRQRVVPVVGHSRSPGSSTKGRGEEHRGLYRPHSASQKSLTLEKGAIVLVS